MFFFFLNPSILILSFIRLTFYVGKSWSKPAWKASYLYLSLVKTDRIRGKTTQKCSSSVVTAVAVSFPLHQLGVPNRDICDEEIKLDDWQEVDGDKLQHCESCGTWLFLWFFTSYGFSVGCERGGRCNQNGRDTKRSVAMVTHSLQRVDVCERKCTKIQVLMLDCVEATALTGEAWEA